MVWLVVFVSLLSGFFSLAGYALRNVRRVSLREQFKDRPKRQASLERNLSQLRLTASFCRAVCNLALVVLLVYLYSFAGKGWDWSAAVAAMATAAGIIAIISVAIPSAWASHAAHRIVDVSYGPLMALKYALFPIIAIMQAFDVPVRRLAGVSDTEESEDSSKAEILQAASDGVAEGTVEHEEIKMIESALEFGDLQAGQIMTPRTEVVALPVETTWLKACEEVVRGGHSRIPVFSGDLDNIVGILYAKDLLRYAGTPVATDLRSIIRKPFFVPESKPLDDLLKEFRARKIHLAIVLDEYGGTAGLVTIEDVLEEIVGEISDEYDRSEPALMHRVDEKTIEVDGRIYIDDVNDALAL